MSFYFQTLLVWQKAFEVTKHIYVLTKTFPADERFSLTDQVKRSSISIMSNIAEWSGRSTNNDKNHFYVISKGSAMELASQLLLAQDLWYITDELLLEKCHELLKDIVNILYSFTK